MKLTTRQIHAFLERIEARNHNKKVFDAAIHGNNSLKPAELLYTIEELADDHDKLFKEVAKKANEKRIKERLVGKK